MFKNVIKDFENKKIAILGFGKEGKSTYTLLRKYLKDIPLTIKDKNPSIKDDPVLGNDANVEIITGDNYLDELDKYDIIMKTPGITLKDIDISNIRNKICSQLEILLKYYKNNIIGITGTKGKSTTSSIIYDVLKNNNKKCLLLGNIGIPIFDFIDTIEIDTVLVVEMSSHQLEFVNSSPHIAIITNLYQDHLDHTKGIDDYYQSKMNITRYQNEDDILIYYKSCNTLDKLINDLKRNSNIFTVDFNNQLSKTYKHDNYIYVDKNKVYNTLDKRNLIGEHNLINVMFALTISNYFNLDNTKTIEAINKFKPLEHRLELVGTFDNITYYNDSIATIPEATINGIEALKNVNTLIFGGMDRGIDYNDFVKYLNVCNVDNLICMPTTGHKIANELIKLKCDKNIYLVNTLEEAVKKAKTVTHKNTICLMSPAASSYEYFKNFEEKGKKFKEYVKENNKNIL